METKEAKKNEKLKENTGNIDRMFAVGAHYGYSKSRRHPSVSPYIFGVKNWVEIINLEKTDNLLTDALEFVKKLGSENKKILFIGSKNEAKNIIKEIAESINMPYVTNRWIGGTLTNFSEIKKRINRMEDLSSKSEKGELADKYTKKEQVMFDREIERLKNNFYGIRSLTEAPSALFIVDTKKEDTAVREAQQLNFPIIGLVNSDTNIIGIDYPIVANDATRASIKFFVNEIAEAYKKGMKEGVKK
ncbi:30S ribosomal protein S2 [Candidatus Campbellbacteria bacterium CG10_big_fil_rev_8_21_14_0_10_35_52]|uniref:Small ribosomal subunit protein uS2 n=1 Tax=Candidatus Campbellbacteria bacterium CG10_big_fil_rev_8_21_14_0_10_35_52 TaxID=1974527 RepID=A0A2M6WVV2_9BACT|nr:MAG: 30S ribosomal protein S2 [Candidatus Campbellbacteria bacterium CG10_big_fil_rev_8_21_14_0_10_35_52]